MELGPSGPMTWKPHLWTHETWGILALTMGSTFVLFPSEGQQMDICFVCRPWQFQGDWEVSVSQHGTVSFIPWMAEATRERRWGKRLRFTLLLLPENWKRCLQNWVLLWDPTHIWDNQVIIFNPSLWMIMSLYKWARDGAYTSSQQAGSLAQKPTYAKLRFLRSHLL